MTDFILPMTFNYFKAVQILSILKPTCILIYKYREFVKLKYMLTVYKDKCVFINLFEK